MIALRCRVDHLLTGKVAALAGTAHLSGIDKEVQPGRIWCGEEGLAGDEQGDRLFHGGPDKAVHHYPGEHYAFWQARLGARELWSRPGAFGENISTRTFTEHEVCIGDRFSLGDVLLEVSQARQPCWRLNLRFAHADMSRWVQQSGKTGWYYRVLQSGWVAAGDELILQARPTPQWPLSRILDVLYCRPVEPQLLRELLTIAGFPPSWRSLFEKRLSSGALEDWSRRLDTPSDDISSTRER